MHMKCLGIKEPVEQDFYCKSCKNIDKNPNPCFICQNTYFIVFSEKKRFQKKHFHEFCKLVHLQDLVDKSEAFSLSSDQENDKQEEITKQEEEC